MRQGRAWRQHQLALWRHPGGGSLRKLLHLVHGRACGSTGKGGGERRAAALALVSKWKAVRLVPPPAGPNSVKVLVPVLSFCGGGSSQDGSDGGWQGPPPGVGC
jgi:hypothetical protein